ncbi:MAG: hypothetical protein ACRELV_11610 [Longimicrobiales bacterium]
MPHPNLEELAETVSRLRRELAILRIGGGGAVVALGVLLLGGAQQRAHFDVLDVERLNVLNADGQPALVLAGQGRLPGPTLGGHEYPQRLSGGRTGAAGMIFFNERGDEVGGLTFHGDSVDDGYSAGGHLAFDQFQQDQVVAMTYSGNDRTRSAGVSVWDRSTEIPIVRVVELLDARLRASGPALDSLNRAIRALVDSGLGAQRIFLGSRDRTASLEVRATDGSPRIRLYVDSLDVARLEFVDSAGSVVASVPDRD